MIHSTQYVIGERNFEIRTKVEVSHPETEGVGICVS